MENTKLDKTDKQKLYFKNEKKNPDIYINIRYLTFNYMQYIPSLACIHFRFQQKIQQTNV